MAAIAPVAISTTNQNRAYTAGHENTPLSYVVRTGAAQATTGQTDWVTIPTWAKFAVVYFNLTSIGASTSPTAILSGLAAPPGAQVDTDTVALFTSATITTASQHYYSLGPGVTGIADGTDSTSADAVVGANFVLPDQMGLKLLFDRGNGDEVYTYTLTIMLRP